MKFLRSIVGRCGELFIYTLIYVFGRRYTAGKVAWLLGPIGGPTISDRPMKKSPRPKTSPSNA